MEGKAETCEVVKGRAGREVTAITDNNFVDAEYMGSCNEEPVKKGAEFWAPGSRPVTTATAGPLAVSPALDQLTIFYRGKVVVFDAIPAGKAQEIMHLAAAAASATSLVELKKIVSGWRPPVASVLTRSPSMQSTASPHTQANYGRQYSFSNLQAGNDQFPYARRHSLQRFLEKRRDRFVSRNPYAASRVAEEEETTTKPETNAAKVHPSPNYCLLSGSY